MNSKAQLMVTTAVVVASAGFANTAIASDFPMQVYQAEYEINSPSLGKSMHKIGSDGRGHGYSEMNSSQSHSRTIIDWQAKKLCILMLDRKMYMTMPLSKNDVSMAMNETVRLNATAKPLGVKLIAGHLCTGTHYTFSEGGTEEIWNGNDIGGVRVYSKTNLPSVGVTEAVLKAYSPASPSLDKLTVPSGYQEINTGLAH